MSTTVSTGLTIGLACAAWTFVMGFAGWHTHPVLLNLFWVVVLIQVALLVLGLGRTAGDHAYWGQVGTGTAMSLVAGVILFISSLLFTVVAFPDYFAELRAMQAQMLRASGKDEAAIAAEVAAAATTQTPFLQALFGFAGTVVTGFVASLVIAAFRRRREPAPSAVAA